MILLGLEDTMALGHLVLALDRHLAWLRENRLPQPPALADLAAMIRKEVTGGQDGSFVDALADAVDAARMTPLLLSLVDAATALGVSPSTVKRLAASDELKTVKVAGARRVHVDDLHAYTDSLRGSHIEEESA